MLLKILRRHTVIAQLGIPRQLIIFLNHLTRRTAHLAFGAGAVEDTIDDVSALIVVTTVAVILGPGPGSGRFHEGVSAFGAVSRCEPNAQGAVSVGQ